MTTLSPQHATAFKDALSVDDVELMVSALDEAATGLTGGWGSLGLGSEDGPESLLRAAAQLDSLHCFEALLIGLYPALSAPESTSERQKRARELLRILDDAFAAFGADGASDKVLAVWLGRIFTQMFSVPGEDAEERLAQFKALLSPTLLANPGAQSALARAEASVLKSLTSEAAVRGAARRL